MKKHAFSNVPKRELDKGEYLGLIELQEEKTGEYQYWEIINTPCCLIFGNPTNNSFLQEGHYIKDNVFSLDENLQELVADLQCMIDDNSPTDRLIH